MRTVLGVVCLAVVAAGAIRSGAAPEARPKPVRTLYASQERLEIRGVTIAPATVPLYGRVELTVQATGTFDNPFDAGDVALDARIVAPSRTAYDVPGFFYRPYRRELLNGREGLTPSGPRTWKIRFCPSEPGVHRLAIRFRDRTGTAVARDRQFVVKPSSQPGFVRVASDGGRYFERENGKPFFPLGTNLTSTSDRGTFDYDEWLAALGRSGANYARLRLPSPTGTFALEQSGEASKGLGAGVIDQANAWRLDHVLQIAGERGVSVQLTIDSYESLAGAGVPGGQWDQNPLNTRNGGPLTSPTEFWTSQTARGLYLKKLRYVVARYGASPHLFAWELWNEVDRSEDYHSKAVRTWHEEVGEALEKLDPYHHPVTTSFHRRGGDPEVERLPEIEFVQAHEYGTVDPARAVAQAAWERAALRKPVLVTEVAADATSSRADEDPKGLQIHDPLWASLASGAAGGAQAACGAEYLPRVLPAHLSAAARFTAGIDWPEEKLRRVPAQVAAAGASRPTPLFVVASAGDDVALAWARLEGRTWQRVTERKEAVPPAPPSTLVLTGLKPGNWKAELWDTWSGRVVGTQAVKVPASRVGRVALPRIQSDLAVKLRRQDVHEAREHREKHGERRREHHEKRGEEEDDD